MTCRLPAVGSCPVVRARAAWPLVVAAALLTGCGDEPKPESKGPSRRFEAYTVSDAKDPGSAPEPEPKSAPDPGPTGKVDHSPPAVKAKAGDDDLAPLPALKKREPVGKPDGPKKAEPPPPPAKKVSVLRDHEWKARESITGHTDRIEWAAFSPDGKLLVTASRDKTLKVWSTADSREMFTLKGHTDRVLCVAFAPDGKSFASGGADKSVRLWEPGSARAGGALFGHTDAVRSIAYSPDGARIATASADKTVRLWDPGRKAEAAVLKGHTLPATSVSFAPDGTPVSAGSDGAGGEIIVWDVEAGKPRTTWKVGGGKMGGIAVSPDGKTVAAACGDRTVKLYDYPSGNLRSVLRGGHRDVVLSVAFCFDSLLLASGGEDLNVVLWDLSENKPVVVFGDQPGFVYFVGFSHNGETLAAAGSGGLRLWGAGLGKPPPPPTKPDDPEKTVADLKDIKVLDIKEKTLGPQKAVVKANFEAYTAVAVTPDGLTALLAGPDYTVLLWQPAEPPGASPIRLSGHDAIPTSISPTPDGKTAAACGFSSMGVYEGELKIWDLAKHRAIYTDKRVGEMYAACAFARDGKRVAVAVNGFDGAKKACTVRIYESVPVTPEPGKSLPKDAPKSVFKESKTLLRSAGHMRGLTWAPDGSRIATVAKHGVQLWDPVAGRAVAALDPTTPDGFTSAAYSPDGSALVLGAADGTVKVTAPSDLVERGSWKAHNGPVTGVAFSSDSRTLVTAGDITGKVWDFKSGKLRFTFSDHKGPISALALSRDGRIGVTIAQDRTARLWTTDDTILTFTVGR